MRLPTHSTPQFGVPLYGGTLTGSVLFIPENHLGCSEFAAPLPAGGALPPVLLVDRGGASALPLFC